MAEIKKVYKNWTAYDVLNSDTVVDAVIPSQSWNSWKFLTTNGSAVSWANVDALPSQTSQGGKFLTTNWTTASWANVDALPSQTGQSWKFLTTNWTSASWAANHTTTTVSLTAAGWSNKTQTVSATGVTASNTVIVSPAPADIADYADCGVYCSAQASGTLTFGCDTAPSGDIVVNVLILN